MFDHLDDPHPFHPSAGLRRDAIARGRRLRLWRRLAAGTAAATVCVAGLGLGGFLYVERRDEAIDRVDVIDQPSPPAQGPLNILLVGVDVESSEEGEPGRTDTILIVRLREDGRIGLLSLPRDLRIPGSERRLNSVYPAEGPQGLVDTVTATTGVPIDHYMELDFEGFQEVVDAVGGVELAVDQPLRDENSGLLVAPSECTTLDSHQALALVRARNLDGDPTADLGRMARLQVLAAAVLAELDDLDDPMGIDRLSRILADHATVDDGLSLTRMVQIGRRVAAAGPESLVPSYVPIVEADDGATLHLAPEAAAVFADFGAVTVPPIAPPPVPGPVTAEPVQAVVPIRPCP